MAKFVYRDRGDESREKRASQGGGAFDHYLKDEYRLYSPQKGENCVRILPPSSHWQDAPHYGLDVWVHFGVGPDKGSVICLDKGVPQVPGMSGKACPICQERMKAERIRDEELSRELRAVKRVVTVVLDRKDEAKGCLVWGMPYTCDQAITKASRNRQSGGWYLIDRPDNGYDMYFSRNGEGLLTKYDGFERAQSSTPVDDRYVEWVENNPIPEMLNWRDYEEVQRIFEGRGRGEERSEDDRPVRSRRDEEERPPRQARDREEAPRRGREEKVDVPWKEEERRPPREASRDEKRFRDRDPGRAQEDADDKSLEEDREHLDRVTRDDKPARDPKVVGRMMDNYDRGEARRRQEEREEEAPPTRQVRRPTAAAETGNGGGNGRDHEPAAKPSAQGSGRAAQLRERFLNREQR